MPKNAVKIFKTIGRHWFVLLIVVILIIFMYNQNYAIWLTIIFIILFTLSYIPSVSFKNKLLNYMKEYPLITDAEISKRLMRPLEKIREEMFMLFKRQKGKKWLIIFLNKRYIFYNAYTIKKFKRLFDKGFGEKQILENLKKEINIKTRAEIKAIEDALITLRRLNKRDISVKTYDVLPELK